MATDFDIDVYNSSWIVLAYVVGIVAFLLLFGKLADIGALKKIFVTGTAIFLVMSTVCAFAPDIWTMTIARFVQGVGASMMSASVPIMIVRLLPANMKGIGMAVMAASSGIAVVIGPLLGGMIVNSLSWRWIFLINVPICLVLLIMTARILPKDISMDRTRLPDIPSALFLASMIGFGFLFLEDLASSPVSHTGIIIPGLMTLLSLVLFILRRRSSKHKVSLVNVDVFRNRAFIFVGMSFFLTTMMAAGVEYLLPYFLQIPWEMDTVTCGLYFTISAIFTIAVSIPVGRWCDKKGCKVPVIVSILLRCVYTSFFIFLIPEYGIIPLVVTMIVMGLSFGISGTSQSTRMVHHSKTELQGEAATIMLVMNYLGLSFGVLLYALVFAFAVPGSTGTPIDELSSGMIIDGFHATAIIGLIIASVALVLSLLVKNIVPKADDMHEVDEETAQI